MEATKLSPWPCFPEEVTLTLVVLPVSRLWTNTSSFLLVSRGTRLSARHQVAVAGDPPSEAVVVALLPAGGHADPGGSARGTITGEGVVEAVRVSGHQV